jgi:hypothetical protein
VVGVVVGVPPSVGVPPPDGVDVSVGEPEFDGVGVEVLFCGCTKIWISALDGTTWPDAGVWL